MIVLKLVVALVLLGLLAGGGFLADQIWNDGRLFYAAAGRDTLVSLCTPPMREDLVSRGFTPADIILGDRPSIGFASSALGRTRTLSGPFTFSDGPDGPRVDGRLVCVVSGKTVKVDVAVDGRPLRAA